MMKLTFYTLSLIGVVALVGCKKDEPEPTPAPATTPTVRIDVQPMFGGNVLELDSTYTTAEGYLVQFTDLKFYLHDIKNGSNTLTDAMLFDYRERGTLLYSGKGDAANYASIAANLGVDASVNHNDPSAFSNSSWLNISNSNDMHWGWNPGYIFVKIEGKVDTIPDANQVFDQTVVFHCGGDQFLQTLQFDNLNWIGSGDKSFDLLLQLDMATFLQGSTQTIDLKTENSSHSAPGQEAITLKVMENFRDALTP